MTVASGEMTPTIAVARNRLGVAAVVAVHALSFVVVPLVLLPLGAAFGLLLLLFLLVTVPHWALIHEAFHGHLEDNPRRNHRTGRLLAILFGAPFLALRFGHLSHHALNSRPSERADLFDPATTSRWRATAIFYFRLLFGLYLLEVAGCLLCFLPRRRLAPVIRKIFYHDAVDARGMAERAERQLLSRDALAEMRTDAAVALAWLALGLVLYGAAAWMLLLALFGRASIASFMDNAPHYGGEVDEPGQGYDLRLTGPLAALVLNTNLHGTHHRHPGLPWTALPAAFTRDGGTYGGSYLFVPWRQLKGPIPVRDARVPDLSPRLELSTEPK